MPRKPPDEKIAELEEKRSQIEAQIQRHKARLRIEERKRETRRKIIAGALALEHASLNPAFGAQLKKLLQEHVTREGDRALFDLKPK